MSWELTGAVLRLRNLTPTEKAVAHSLAFHAPKHGSAYPSMALIAREAGLGNRTAAQKVVRRLEAKGIISPTTSKKGGRKNPTRYQFNLGNSIPTDALSATINSIPRDANCRETASLETGNSIPTDARDSKETKERDGTLANFPPEMERKIWEYYLELIRPGPNYSLTIDRKRMLAARHAEMISTGKTPERAACHLCEAIYAFSEDDYYMGRKKGYEGAGRKGIEEIFATQGRFEDWCSKYHAKELAK